MEKLKNVLCSDKQNVYFMTLIMLMLSHNINVATSEYVYYVVIYIKKLESSHLLSRTRRVIVLFLYSTNFDEWNKQINIILCVNLPMYWRNYLPCGTQFSHFLHLCTSYPATYIFINICLLKTQFLTISRIVKCVFTFLKLHSKQKFKIPSTKDVSLSSINSNEIKKLPPTWRLINMIGSTFTLFVYFKLFHYFNIFRLLSIYFNCLHKLSRSLYSQ